MQYGEPGGRITRDRGMVSWGEGATRLPLSLPQNRIAYAGVTLARTKPGAACRGIACDAA